MEAEFNGEYGVLSSRCHFLLFPRSLTGSPLFLAADAASLLNASVRAGFGDDVVPGYPMSDTTKGFLKNILFKLHVADRTEAVTVAIQRGLIHL